MAHTGVNGDNFSKGGTGVEDMSQTSTICLYLPCCVADLKIPELSLQSCPLIVFLETINDVTEEIRGSSRINVRRVYDNGAMMLAIYFACAHCPSNHSSDITLDSLKSSAPFCQPITMRCASFSTLKEIFYMLLLLLNDSQTILFKIEWYGV